MNEKYEAFTFAQNMIWNNKLEARMNLSQEVIEQLKFMPLEETIMSAGLDTLRRQFDKTTEYVSKALYAVRSILQRYNINVEAEEVYNLQFNPTGILRMNLRLMIDKLAPNDPLAKLLQQDIRQVKGAMYDFNKGEIHIQGVGV